MEKIITRLYLRKHPFHIFVFGDNCERRGYGGAAALRDMTNTYGFITKKSPTHSDRDYYRPKEYEAVYFVEMEKLKQEILHNPTKHYLISKLGAGLANRYNIFEQVIEPNIRKDLAQFSNVEFLW